MHAVDDGGALALSRVSAAATLAWIMNSSISRCASSRCGTTTRSHLAVGVEHDLALGQIEIERLAPVAGGGERRVGGPQRLQRALQQRRGTSRSAGRRWRPAPPRRTAWRPSASGRARSVWPRLLPCLSNTMRATRHGPHLALAQRAQVVGDALGQHRHDAVGEVDRVAADARLAIEAAAGADVVGDVGDGDVHDPAVRGSWDRRRAAACTASSWSRASTGSMVSRVRSRRSTRPCERWAGRLRPPRSARLRGNRRGCRARARRSG